MWSTHPLFHNCIASNWLGIEHPDPFIKLSLLHHKTSKALRRWGWETFGNVFSNVLSTEKEVERLEAAAQNNLATETDLLTAQSNLIKAIDIQDLILKQKASISGFSEGTETPKSNYTGQLNLIEPPSVEEIWQALSSIDSSKAAGPDGELQKTWEKHRPISLTSVISKLISKIIELTLGLDKISRGGNLIYKLDIKKAYDTIDWNFIFGMLTTRGFQHEFRNLIQRWLTNNNHSILINGQLQGNFTASRALKQGDPLSPTIFIIVMDYFSRMLDRNILNNQYSRFHHRSNLAISHLMYVDDIMIFSNVHKLAVKKLEKYTGGVCPLHCGLVLVDGREQQQRFLWMGRNNNKHDDKSIQNNK
ncbi:uncharacterized protein LOC110036820, partial [Phalaenopsis equestris]|uniref:uncharacterized protein LOC110036820 n=1 Tax=Phalaenopsis equestris TaxID=78828 RepID=UPI0009E462D9